MIAGVIVALDDGDELHEGGADFIAQELVDARALPFVGGVHGSQDVVLGFVLLQQAQPRHHLVVGRVAAFIDAVEIVHILRTVQADAEQEVVLGEELAPVVIEGDGVGLQGVGDAHAWALVLLLVAHRLAEKVQAHQRRLAALPSEVDLIDLLRLDVLADVFLEQAVRHAEFAAGIEFFFGEEIAVFAIKVADGASRLGHQVKSGGLSGRGLHGWEYSGFHHRGTVGTELQIGAP